MFHLHIVQFEMSLIGDGEIIMLDVKNTNKGLV